LNKNGQESERDMSLEEHLPFGLECDRCGLAELDCICGTCPECGSEDYCTCRLDPPDDLTCIHAESGLCPRCIEEYRYDPDSYLEFGDHPAGLARFRQLQAELAREALEAAAARERGEVVEVDWDAIPY
jgi:hypothetical protein